MASQRTSKADIIAQIPAARLRELKDRDAGMRATSVRYDRRTGRIVMELTNGFIFGFPSSRIPALSGATIAQLADVELTAGGSGLHWDSLDADLSVPGLLLSSVGRAQKLTELAREAGRTKSNTKAAASRTNGAKGGRPRKASARV
jgi:hypothetical protein